MYQNQKKKRQSILDSLSAVIPENHLRAISFLCFLLVLLSCKHSCQGQAVTRVNFLLEYIENTVASIPSNRKNYHNLGQRRLMFRA